MLGTPTVFELRLKGVTVNQLISRGECIFSANRLLRPVRDPGRLSDFGVVRVLSFVWDTLLSRRRTRLVRSLRLLPDAGTI